MELYTRFWPKPDYCAPSQRKCQHFRPTGPRPPDRWGLHTPPTHYWPRPRQRPAPLRPCGEEYERGAPMPRGTQEPPGFDARTRRRRRIPCRKARTVQPRADPSCRKRRGGPIPVAASGLFPGIIREAACRNLRKAARLRRSHRHRMAASGVSSDCGRRPWPTDRRLAAPRAA